MAKRPIPYGPKQVGDGDSKDANFAVFYCDLTAQGQNLNLAFVASVSFVLVRSLASDQTSCLPFPFKPPAFSFP